MQEPFPHDVVLLSIGCAGGSGWAPRGWSYQGCWSGADDSQGCWSWPDIAMNGTPLLYAFTLGLVAALNPCGFPLLPAYVTGFVGRDADRPWPVRTVRALGSSLAVTVGFVAVFAPLGGLVSAGVNVVMGWVPWAMIPFGVALVGFGLWTASGRSVKVRLPVMPAGRGRGPVVRMVLFGVAYAVASLSCALPVFVAGVSGSFHRNGFAGGVESFVAYALGMGLLLAVVAMVVAHAGVPALRRARRLGPALQRLVGVVLVLVGAYLVLYWASFVADPSSTPGAVRAVEHVQSILVAWLSSAPRTIGLVLGIGVIGALAAVAASRSGGAGGGAPAGAALDGGGAASRGGGGGGGGASEGRAAGLEGAVSNAGISGGSREEGHYG